MEYWKQIEGWPNYEISNFGNVKSNKGKTERLLKQSPTDRGYLRVNLSNDNKSKTKYIHKLVAVAFLGHVPDGMNVIIDHIDNRKGNNHVSNLQLTTNRENTSKDRTGGHSNHVGVSWDKSRKKWIARIRINGKQTHLGSFTDETAAATRYHIALNALNATQ
mgnify:CR=1 FL=1